MTQAFDQRISSALQQRRQTGLTRQRVLIEKGNQTFLTYGEHAYLNFSGNDYLGLANAPEVISAWQEGLSLFGAGSGASPLVTGYSAPHANLETQLAEWLGFDNAVLFNSGFSANQAVLFSLLQADDVLLQDKLNHASLMEAGMHSPAQMRRFVHNDCQQLETLLSKSDKNTLVVTEGVFSMDGDCAPLQTIAQLTSQPHHWLMVDDAHGCGVLGESGRGSCDLAGIQPDILVVTFGKAFGLSGAAVLCNEECADFLSQFARHHVYSTAMPPAQAHALSQALFLIQTQEWRREKLLELGAELESQLQSTPGLVHTQTPIKPFIIGDAEQTVRVAEQLRQQGIWATAIRPPTVPVGSARLRITLSANHSVEHITQLSTSLMSIMDNLGESHG